MARRGTRLAPAVRATRVRLLLTALLLTVATACTTGTAVDIGGSGGTAVAAGPQLTAAIAAEPDQLDPHQSSAYATFEVLENVFDTLVEPDENLTMQPALADSWTVTPDQRSWTFRLHPGVRWQDGTPFTADDVVYSYRRIVDEELSNSYRLESVRTFTAVDPLTVRMDLTRPTPNLLENLGSYKGMAIVQRRNVESGEIARRPVGTGPFAVASYTPGDSVVLTRNPDYFRGAPPLASVRFTFVKESTVAYTNLTSGEAQWTDNIPPAKVQALVGRDDPVVRSVPSNDYWYFAFNSARKPFDDPRVRQAVAYAFDRGQVVDAAKFGGAQVNQTAIPPSSPWHVPYAPYTRDLPRARALLQEAGVPDLSFDFMVTTEYPETVQAAQVLADQLADAGITLRIRVEDLATWLDNQSNGAFDSFALGWLGNVDPDDFYYAQFRTGGSSNYQKYSNPAVDRLLDQARQEVDRALRQELYAQVTRLIVDDASYVFLYNPDNVQGWAPEVRGYVPRQDKAVRFRTVSLEGS